MTGLNDSSNDTGMSSINRLLESSTPEGRHLLANVSLMTTTTPIPSRNNSLQRSNNAERNSDDNFLDRIRNKIGTDKITEEHEKSQISTLTAFEDQLHEHLNCGESTAVSSTPAASVNLKHTENGTAQIMYGFDLSPAHSVERKSDTKISDTSEKIMEDDFDDAFQQSKPEVQAAPNFMQAKLASPRHLRSEKVLMSEDTETMMSQVFSSQDQSASVTRLSQQKSSTAKKSQKSIVSSEKKKREKSPQKTQSKKNETFNKSKSLQRKGQSTVYPSGMHDYSNHSRLQTIAGGKNSKLSAQKKTPTKVTSSRQSRMAANIITPKSPKSRQGSVKVSSRIKSSPSVHMKRSSSSLKSPPSQRMLIEGSKMTLDSSAQSQTNISMWEKSFDSSHQQREQIKAAESGVLLHMVQDLDYMKVQMKELHDQLGSVTQEKEQLERRGETYVEENQQLKKDNFVMKSKIARLTSQNKSEVKHDSSLSKKVSGNESPHQEDASKLKLEISEQERLIQGYQQENERIYQDLRDAKRVAQETEHAMYEENQKLKSEVANLEETVERNARIIKGMKDSNNKLPSVSAYNSVKGGGGDEYQRKIKALENQIKMEEGMRHKAEAALKKVIEERDTSEKQLQISQCKNEEMRENMKADHKIEIESLQSQLEEARRLLHENRNSPSMSPYRGITRAASSSELSHFQKRVKKLESDLEKRDMLANRAVQAVQTEYNTVKMKYEERINDLEEQIESFKKHTTKGRHSMDSGLKTENAALKQQLVATSLKLREIEEDGINVKEGLEKKIQSLLQQTRTIESPKVQKPDEVLMLKRKCDMKDVEISRLQALLREAGESLSVKQKRQKSGSRERRPNQAKYDPGVFEGEGYADILEQNKELKKQVENLSIEMKHNRVINDALVIKMEQESKTTKEKNQRKISLLRKEQSKTELATHQENQRSDVLKNQMVLLEKELDRCKEHILRLKNDNNESAVLKIREQALQGQVQQLLKELHQVKSSSPSTRNVAILEDKLRVLEEQFCIKEDTFKRALMKNSSSVIQLELQRLQGQLDEKNNQLSRFRMELDSILLVLNELKSQGVKIPLPKYLQSIF